MKEKEKPSTYKPKNTDEDKEIGLTKEEKKKRKLKRE